MNDHRMHHSRTIGNETTSHHHGIGRKRIKGIVFDCFGTLVEVTDPRGVHRTVRRIVGGRLRPSPMVVDVPIVEMVARAAPDATVADLDALRVDIAAEVASIRPIRGAMDAYRAFSDVGFDIVLASNLACDYAEPLWDMLDAEFRCFSFIHERVKPDPRFFGDVLNHFAWNPDQILMVGDSYASDHLGAIGVGMNSVLISNRQYNDVETISHISLLPQWFASRW